MTDLPAELQSLLRQVAEELPQEGDPVWKRLGDLEHMGCQNSTRTQELEQRVSRLEDCVRDLLGTLSSVGTLEGCLGRRTP
jgi:hypothetical protein|tara:strand:- start:44 stop:286 length:243 start_codon:yes stop_codon:yes gene_type:complete